jgi:hypothetical protein
MTANSHVVNPGISFGPRNGKKIGREVIKEEFDVGLFKYLPKFHIQKGV